MSITSGHAQFFTHEHVLGVGNIKDNPSQHKTAACGFLCPSNSHVYCRSDVSLVSVGLYEGYTTLKINSKTLDREKIIPYGHLEL